MSDFLVTLMFEPGTPRSFAVVNVGDAYDARKRVLEVFGYDPGVPVEVVKTPINKNEPVRFSNLGGSND